MWERVSVGESECGREQRYARFQHQSANDETSSVQYESGDPITYPIRLSLSA